MKNVVSLAYAVYKNCYWKIFRTIYLLFDLITSKTNIKRKADIGSSCLVPFFNLKFCLDVLFYLLGCFSSINYSRC